MNDKTIIIDITEANKAKKYSDDGLFQIESFKKVEEILIMPLKIKTTFKKI